MKKILIVEDMKDQALGLQNILSNYSQDLDIIIASSYSEASQIIHEQDDFSLFFLDIQLSENVTSACDGVSLGLEIRDTKRYLHTPIIYVTSYSNRIQDALNKVHCFAFLYKPYSPQDVTNLLDELLSCQKSVQSLQLKIDTSIYANVELSQLIYVQAQGHYLLYKTTNGVYTSRQYNMKQLLQELPNNFIRCHKSYIINKNFILNMDTVNQYVQLKDHKYRIPLGKNVTLF